MPKKMISVEEWTALDVRRMCEWLQDLVNDLDCDEGEDHDDMIGISDHVAKARGLVAHLKQLPGKKRGRSEGG